jgi:hypothetical protein
MSFLTDTENAIVERLKEKLPNVKVEPFPDNIQEYQFLTAKNAVLVHYLGSTAEPSQSPNTINQQLTVRWGITILSRGLRLKEGVSGGEGAYQILDKVKSALIGFRVDGCSKMFMESELFTDNSPSGVWCYQFTAAMETNYMED